jgi:serine phosphatase RsbU (regulator of sigma subunit)
MIVLDPVRHKIRLVNAGHLPPLLRHADGSVVYLGQAESGMPLGIATDQQFQEIEYPLRENDTLLLYTDGVTEAMNEKMQIFGRQRLMDFLRTAPTNAQNIVSSLVEEVESYCGSSTQRDDLCVVVFGRRPAEEQDLSEVKLKGSRITSH